MRTADLEQPFRREPPERARRERLVRLAYERGATAALRVQVSDQHEQVALCGGERRTQGRMRMPVTTSKAIPSTIVIPFGTLADDAFVGDHSMQCVHKDGHVNLVPERRFDQPLELVGDHAMAVAAKDADDSSLKKRCCDLAIKLRRSLLVHLQAPTAGRCRSP